MKIHKGDDVVVLTGKFRGERADVEEALPEVNKVILDNLNVAKRATKQSGSHDAGRHHRQAHAAQRVATWPSGAPSTRARRGSASRSSTSKKVRVCRKCGEVL